MLVLNSVMGWQMVFGVIIHIMLEPLIPEDFKGLSCCCLSQPVTLHVPRLVALDAHRYVDKEVGHLIVHLDLGWLLRMSGGFKDSAEAHSGLAVVEEHSTLRFFHRTDTVSECVILNEDWGVMRGAVII
eukprot:8695972-Ditylum_brightwellii.AAC.1